mgnify:CR=1 FL=1
MSEKEIEVVLNIPDQQLCVGSARQDHFGRMKV